MSPRDSVVTLVACVGTCFGPMAMGEPGDALVSFRLFKPMADGSVVYGPWMAPGEPAASARRGVLPELVYDQTAGVFGGDICDPQPSPTDQAYPYVWTSWYNDIELAPEDAGKSVDGAVFAFEIGAIPAGYSGPFSPNVQEQFAGQHAGCHQMVWNLSFWETIDEGVDTNGDGVADVFGAYPVFDAAGVATGDITPVPNFSADLDGDGTPDVGDPLAYADQDGDEQNDSFLGGYQLFVIGGFNPPDDNGNGAVDVDEFICPDLNLSGDPFDDFFNPPGVPGLTNMSNYAQVGGGIDFASGFLTAIDAGLGLAFDIDGDGSSDIPRLPADGRGAIQFEALNVIDSDMDGVFDAIDGPALIGQPAVGSVSAFAPSSPELPGFSSGLLYVEGEDRLGGGAIPSAGGGLPADGVFTPGSSEIRVADPDVGACQEIREPAVQVYAGDGPLVMFLCADQNGDGEVSPTDFCAWLANYNAGDGRADANQNGEVEPTDFGAWLGAFNQGAGGPVCSAFEALP